MENKNVVDISQAIKNKNLEKSNFVNRETALLESVLNATIDSYEYDLYNYHNDTDYNTEYVYNTFYDIMLEDIRVIFAGEDIAELEGAYMLESTTSCLEHYLNNGIEVTLFDELNIEQQSMIMRLHQVVKDINLEKKDDNNFSIFLRKLSLDISDMESVLRNLIIEK